MCIFVLNPPRERPSFSSSSPLFFHQPHVGEHAQLFHRRNEPASLAFLVRPSRLAALLTLAAKFPLFASDKTELLHFPTFHNVLAGLATVPRFLVSTGCHLQSGGGHDWASQFGVFGVEVAVLTAPTVRYLSLLDSSLHQKSDRVFTSIYEFENTP